MPLSSQIKRQETTTQQWHQHGSSLSYIANFKSTTITYHQQSQFLLQAHFLLIRDQIKISSPTFFCITEQRDNF